MNLKDKILEILEKEKHSFKELAEYVNMSEAELTSALETKKLELRTLELISKGLKIPLYSFFRSDKPYHNPDEQPYYVNKLWQGEPSQNANDLIEEITILKEILNQKQTQLNNLK